MTDMKNVSVLLDDDTLKRVVKMMKKRNEFSRSKLLRDLIKAGLESNNK